jgi:hypothetical protein
LRFLGFKGRVLMLARNSRCLIDLIARSFWMFDSCVSKRIPDV